MVGTLAYEWRHLLLSLLAELVPLAIGPEQGEEIIQYLKQ